MNRWERKRKARDEKKNGENGADSNDTAQEDVDITNKKHPILVQFPQQQPTHAGFLTSATLFPKE